MAAVLLHPLHVLRRIRRERPGLEHEIVRRDLQVGGKSRFFLIFQYEARMKSKGNSVAAVIQRLNEEADTASLGDFR